MTAKQVVMDFKILRRSAILATPAVPVEYEESELVICFRIKSDSATLRLGFDHADAF
jgi:hypothetical protein